MDDQNKYEPVQRREEYKPADLYGLAGLCRLGVSAEEGQGGGNACGTGGSNPGSGRGGRGGIKLSLILLTKK